MKKLYISISMTIIFAISSLAQNEYKDSLFLSDKDNYLKLKINYEGNHSFLLSKEKFVTSAFSSIINESTLNHFTQVNTSYRYDSPIILQNYKPKKIYDIKKYLKRYRKKLIDKKSKKYDSYKLMLHFNNLEVFIKRYDDSFIKVSYVTSLPE